MTRLAAALLAFFVLLTPAWAAPKFPALTGRVVDDANILSAQTKSDLDTKLAALEQKNSRQLVVVTIPSLGGYEISDYGYQLGRAWGIVGHLNSGVSIPASTVYAQAGIPMVTGSSTNPKLTEQGLKTVFRTVGRDDQQGPAIASYLAAEYKPKLVAI